MSGSSERYAAERVLQQPGRELHRLKSSAFHGALLRQLPSIALQDGVREQLPDLPIPVNARLAYTSAKPILFGHYWLTGRPELQSEYAACRDYSVALGGVLCAYRWDGETALNADHLCWV